MEFSPRSLKFMQITFALLLALTIGLLTWQHYGMAHVLELSATQAVRMQPGDDRGMGGASVATVNNDGKTIKFDCTIVKKFDAPFCTLIFFIGDGIGGIDLSQHAFATFDIAYRGAGKHQVRNMVMNFEQGSSRLDDWTSPKVNEIEFEVPAAGIVTVPLKVYRTAPWWIELRNVPLEKAAPNLDNVVRIELLTGTNAV